MNNQHDPQRSELRGERRQDQASASRPRGLRRLRLHRRFVPLLVAIALVSTFGIVGLATIGARANAIAAAQTQARQGLQVERQLLADQGANVTLNNGQLVAGIDNGALILNGDTSIVDHTRDLMNAYATIYELEGDRLTAISTNLPAHGSSTRALGDTLSGPAYDALLGQCGATESMGCHRAYAGAVTLHGTAYVAAFQPLFDANDTFVGALGIAIPEAAVVAPTTQLAVMLLLVGMFLALLALVGGIWIFDALEKRVLASLDVELDEVADAAVGLTQLARSQIDHSSRQDRVVRQITEQVRSLNIMAQAMEQGHTALRDAAGEIWAEMSQPGLAPNPAQTLRWAKQAAVVSAQVGTNASHARDICRQLVSLMNHITAEGNAITDGGREIALRAVELRKSVDQVELTLGERLVRKARGMSTVPWRKRGQAGKTPPQAVRRPGTGVLPAAGTGQVPRLGLSSGQLTHGQQIHQTGHMGVISRPRHNPHQPQRGPGAPSQFPRGNTGIHPTLGSWTGMYQTPPRSPNPPSQLGKQFTGEWSAQRHQQPPQTPEPGMPAGEDGGLPPLRGMGLPELPDAAEE
jgi:hypothetical protein